MKIKLSKKQWEQIGKTAGWMKISNDQSGHGIDNAMQGLASGVKDNANAKIQEYVKRINSGEPKETVLQGLPPSFITKIEQALSGVQIGTPTQGYQSSNPYKQDVVYKNDPAYDKMANKKTKLTKSASGNSECKECGAKFPTEDCMTEEGVMKGCPKCGSKYVRKI